MYITLPFSEFLDNQRFSSEKNKDCMFIIGRLEKFR